MILAGDAGGPREGPGQAAAVPARRTSTGIFQAMKGQPVTIRTARSAAARVLAARRRRARPSWPRRSGVRPDVIAGRVQGTARVQPDARLSAAAGWASSTRRSRAMQARAIFEAAVQRARRPASTVEPEVMIPLVGFLHRIAATRRRSSATTAEKVFAEKGVKVEVPGRHDDRVAAGLHGGRPDRQGRASSSASAPTT